MNKFFKRLFLGGALLFGMGVSAFAGGYDLSKSAKFYGITSNITMKTGRVFTGNMFIVDSTNAIASDNASSGNFDVPFATIDYAVGRCTANNGDLILVLPNHLETVTAAAGLDLDVAGITIAGIGTGLDMPTVRFTTATTADMDVDAANITIYNLLFVSGIDALVAPIDVNSNFFQMIDCITTETLDSGTGQASLWISCVSDNCLFDGVEHLGTDAAGCNEWFQGEGADDLTIRNFKVYGNFAYSAIALGTGTVCLRSDVHNGYIWTENAADICGTSSATSTGKWGPDIYCRLQDNAANITEAVQGAACQFYAPILIVNANNEYGTDTNITYSTD